MLAKRNASDLASSLEPFLGSKSQLIFGIGVLAMAISTMIVHMMMNGYAISEAFDAIHSASLLVVALFVCLDVDNVIGKCYTKARLQRNSWRCHSSSLVNFSNPTVLYPIH